MLPADLRDTRFWVMFDMEEKENYVYVLNKFNQAQSDVEFAVSGRLPTTPVGLGELLDIMRRAYVDLIDYESTLLLKYWHRPLPQV